MRQRRGFTILLAIWVIAIGVVLIAAIQWASTAHAVSGRESMARARAYWAARGGLEAAVAAIEHATLNPDVSDAFSLLDDLAEVGQGSMLGASYEAIRDVEGERYYGASDAHAKLNLNTMTAEQLMLLPYMTEDVADAILDWIDADDDVLPMGAEASQYSTLAHPYEPRNGPFRSLAEVELVLGVYPEYVRGEDWNLNGVLDENEDDGSLTWPEDNADGQLDAGWSGIVTVTSRGGGLAASGEERLDLTATDASEIATRLGVTTTQAEVILDYVAVEGAALGDFVRTALNRLRDPSTGQIINAQADALSLDQLAALLDETAIGAPEAGVVTPGKLNLNTCEAEALEYLPGLDPALADSIIFERESRTSGFASVVDLLDVPTMSRAQLANLLNVIDVRSNAMDVCVRGIDQISGIEVEIVATIDRSTVPVTISGVHIR